jgi:DNA-binding NarL/FixJ family response regulator
MKILIVDDHPMVLKGMLSLLKEHYPESEFYKAGSVAEAKRCIAELAPDIVFQDINLADGNGFSVLKSFRDSCRAKWIVLSTYQDPELVREAIEHGADGFICKDADDDEIVQSVTQVIQGKKYFSSTIMQGLVSLPAQNRKHGVDLSALTPTERKVLYLVAQAKTSKEIAEQLNVSYRTVENHRNNICSKLGLYGTNALLHFAVHYKTHIETDRQLNGSP